MTHQSCEFCGRHIAQIPFGGYSHSADRTALCGGKPVRPASGVATNAIRTVRRPGHLAL
ncbi:hypothetical protein Br6_04826 [Rhodococcus sp. Br-6]|nr:hypothetical protein Br6_04826 [Rhodococcus sp. Br-6]